MSAKVSLVLALCLCMAATARAQRAYTLEECIAAATANSPDLRVAGMELRASTLARDEAQTLSLPAVRLEGEALYAPHSGWFGYDPALSNGGQLGGRVTIQQPLYDGGARRLRAAELGLDIQRHTAAARAVALDVRLAVTQAFIDGLRTGAAIVVRRESAAELTRYADLVTTMNAAGTASQSDVLKTRVELDAETVALNRALESDSLAHIVIAQRMGFANASPVTISGSLDSMPIDACSEAFEVNDSVFKNVDVTVAQLGLAMGRADVELGATERLPSIALGADAGVMTSMDNFRLAPPDRSPLFGLSVGAQFSMPLSSWGAFDLRAQQRELDVDARRERFHQLLQSIGVARKSLVLHLRATRDRLAALRRTIATAHDNLSLTAARFATGSSGSLDVLTAQQTLLQLRSDVIDAQADLLQTAAQLSRICAQE